MEEEFYATVKLLSGEELVAKVCYSGRNIGFRNAAYTINATCWFAEILVVCTLAIVT